MKYFTSSHRPFPSGILFTSTTCRQMYFLLLPRLQKLGLDDIEVGLTALQWAAQNGHETLANQAILGGAKIHEPSSKLRGRTPLHLAVLGSHIGVIRILAKHGAALSTKLDSSSTALHLAAKNGKAKSIAVLLELGADMMCTNNLGDTPAHSAAAYGYIGCMKAILDAGFDPNTRGQKGRTIMHTAAIHSIAMLEFLLANNRDLLHIDAQDDEVVLHTSMLEPSGDLCSRIRANSAPCSSLFERARAVLACSSTLEHNRATHHFHPYPLLKRPL